MDKQQLIALVKQNISAGVISPAEITAAISDGAERSSSRIVSILYGIGALIVVIGIAILVGSNWEELGFAARLIVTFGVALATYAAGFLVREEGTNKLSNILFTISAVLAPVSAAVFLSEFDIEPTYGVQAAVSLVVAAVYASAWWALRRHLLLMYVAIPLSWMYYATLLWLASDLNDVALLLQWATIALGAAYLVFARAYRNSAIVSFFEFFGTLGILVACFSFDNLIADILFIPVLFAGFYASTVIKSRIMLALSALFLIAYLIQLSVIYFANSIGWSFAMIIAGFLIIGIGYGTLRFSRKYIQE